jgi:hypothetical protein
VIQVPRYADLRSLLGLDEQAAVVMTPEQQALVAALARGDIDPLTLAPVGEP